MISFDEALDLLCARITPLGREAVPLASAHGRILADSVVARVSAPPCNVSAMDGYAVREVDLASLPASLPVAGAAFAGRTRDAPLELGQCVRIFTGAPVPAGADRVVVQEIVRQEADHAIFETAPGKSRNIRTEGSDFRAGETLLEAGTSLGPRELVAAAAADVAELDLWVRPRVGLLSTGDELAPPGSALATPGAIPESVSFGVAAMATEFGGIVTGSVRLADDLTAMEVAAGKALDDADLLIVTGGASVGEKDFAKRMFEPVGLELVFSKVAIRPGKPVWLGRARNTWVLGLPGNPTSAMVTARLFLAPLLYGLGGRDPGAALRWRQLPLLEDLEPTGDRETFARGVPYAGSVRILGNQDSSAQKDLVLAEFLVRRHPGHMGVAAGTLVSVLDF